MEDFTEEQRQTVRSILARDFEIYEAAVRNGGRIRMRHHLQLDSVKINRDEEFSNNLTRMSVERHSNASMRFVIATAVTVNTGTGRLFSNAAYNELFSMAQQNWNHYALLHGYTLSVQNEEVFVEGRKAGWAEIDVIRKHFALGYEYVMYTDIDWLFVDMTKSLEDLINADLDKHIYVSNECWYSPNKKLMQGTLIMKNSEISKAFLDEWEALHDAFDGEINHSQIAFEQMLKTSRDIVDPKSEYFGFGPNSPNDVYNIEKQHLIEQWERWSKYVHVFPPWEFMTYDKKSCDNKQGVFGIHFPGQHKEKRMLKIAKEVVQKQSIAPQQVFL